MVTGSSSSLCWPATCEKRRLNRPKSRTISEQNYNTLRVWPRPSPALREVPDSACAATSAFQGPAARLAALVARQLGDQNDAGAGILCAASRVGAELPGAPRPQAAASPRHDAGGQLLAAPLDPAGRRRATSATGGHVAQDALHLVGLDLAPGDVDERRDAALQREAGRRRRARRDRRSGSRRRRSAASRRRRRRSRSTPPVRSTWIRPVPAGAVVRRARTPASRRAGAGPSSRRRRHRARRRRQMPPVSLVP